MAARITTPFGARTTAAEVVAGVDLTGRRAIVTGASSGIGAETARVLAGAGAEVTLAVRDVAAGERVAAGITAARAAYGWRGSTWPIGRRSRRSSPRGTGRCTSS
ncbi:SDR family NAD(P)-dependent oxidoreductase [Actinoallomurus spadix]|nr:SDR family NAD(P)-dependent oxidoreductase [Actinoallomurus spadix]MCO5984947.1 SDR family NAD(P)-dependent oxidoreductase [Actinoallomurus spadix]